MKAFNILTTLFVTANISSLAYAQNSSAEFQCRSKAKEIAAETYKGCMTDQRQAQLEQIRKDYKEKLSELKSHYDKELKKISTGNQLASNEAINAGAQPQQKTTTKETPAQKKAAKPLTRASGARSLPPKRAPIKTQVIDLSSPSGMSETEPIETAQDLNRLKIEQDDAHDVEVVELPSQE